MPKVRFLKCYEGEHYPNGTSQWCQCGNRYYATQEQVDRLYEGTEHESAKNDIINNPNHYVQGIECWDYIISQNLNYLEGNVIKYVTRHKHKNGKEDLLKAKAYLEKLLETQYPEK